jgi:virginiamycin B lyase
VFAVRGRQIVVAGAFTVRRGSRGTRRRSVAIAGAPIWPLLPAVGQMWLREQVRQPRKLVLGQAVPEEQGGRPTVTLLEVVERLEHVLRRTVDDGRGRAPVDEVLVGDFGGKQFGRQRVVAGDDVGWHVDRGEDEGDRHAGPVLARGTADDGREGTGLEERPNDLDELRSANVEHEPVDVCQALPRPRVLVEQRDVPVPDGVGGAEHARVFVELARPAQIDDLAEAERDQLCLRCRGQPVECVGSEQRPPPGAEAVSGRVATDVAQVARAREPDVAIERDVGVPVAIAGGSRHGPSLRGFGGIGDNDRTVRASRIPVLLLATAALAVAACDGATGPSPTARPGTPAATVPQATPRATEATPATSAGDPVLSIREYKVPAGSHPHDVAPAAEGGVWYTGQRNGTLVSLDPSTGEVREIPLGAGSAPHGVIVGPDGAPWITDGGLNAILRVDPRTFEVRSFPLPSGAVNLNTATFDRPGVLWFTGQGGVYGRVDPADGVVRVFDAPRGRGPYGITTTPGGDVWYASLAGNHIARIDTATGEATVVEPPTAGQGARRVWSDSRGRLWVAEWNAGQLGMHDPATGEWREWRLPGDDPQAYAVYVDDRDIVWLTDFGANAIVQFDPATEQFTSIALPDANAAVRQLLGRPGEVWGAESGLDRLVVVTER